MSSSLFLYKKQNQFQVVVLTLPGMLSTWPSGWPLLKHISLGSLSLTIVCMPTPFFHLFLQSPVLPGPQSDIGLPAAVTDAWW